MYTQTSGHKFNLSKIAQGFSNSVSALLAPDNANAAMYSFLSAGLGLYSLVLLFGSHEVPSFVCLADSILFLLFFLLTVMGMLIVAVSLFVCPMVSVCDHPVDPGSR